MTKVTAVLLNYRRPQNMYKLVEKLCIQTVKPEIMLINNSSDHFAISGVDKYIHIPWNAGCWIRLPFARYAEGDHILFMDDDVLPGENTMIEYLLDTSRDGAITGIVGKTVARAYPHYREDVRDGDAHIVKGRFMFFEKELLAQVPMSIYQGKHDIRFLEDIYMSLCIGMMLPIHKIDSEIKVKEVNLSSRDGVGISEEPGHMERRHNFCKWFLEGQDVSLHRHIW